jgi:glycosyltransferase involved in cell wall biosynthesis
MILSVVIVTKNRVKDLKICIESLARQTVLPDELLIIDNNSSDSTKETVLKIQKKINFPLQYIRESGYGFPVIYNTGLKQSKCSWVAFVDDDCVADKNWCEQIKFSINKHPKAAAIIGRSETFYSNNVYSLAMLFDDNFWKSAVIKNNNVIDLEILDNKNIVYNKSFLFEHKLEYDESRSVNQMGASEDCDLGMQIQKAGGLAFYNEKMLITHKDSTNIHNYFKKSLNRANAHLTYEIKWSDYRKRLNLNHKKRKMVVELFRFAQNKMIPVWKTIYLIILLTTLHGIIKIMKYQQLLKTSLVSFLNDFF